MVGELEELAVGTQPGRKGCQQLRFDADIGRDASATVNRASLGSDIDRLAGQRIGIGVGIEIVITLLDIVADTILEGATRTMRNPQGDLELYSYT